MGYQKLFGGGKGAFSGGRNRASSNNGSGRKKKEKTRSALRLPIILLVLILLAESVYCVCVFSDIPFIKKWRDIYIEMALTSMTKQWLATELLPGYMIDEYYYKVEQARLESVGKESTWSTPASQEKPGNSEHVNLTLPTDPTRVQEVSDPDKEAFLNLFWELDVNSVDRFVAAHPEAIANGWQNFYVNEAGTGDNDKTSMVTIMGEPVMAVDAQNGVLILRVSGADYRGVLAVCKDPSRLHLKEASSLGSTGQTVARIASNNNALVAMTGSPFVDDDGKGNGGQIAGFAMCDGKSYGTHFPAYMYYKRLELWEDDRMYIRDTTSSVGESTTDAVEFTPALIVDGEIIVDENCGWNGTNPRAVLGQSSAGEVLMLVIEGRLVGTSLGCGVVECANILARHGCAQAMNLDGGTSAMLWYEGESITLCSNTALPDGRGLPNAWIYSAD